VSVLDHTVAYATFPNAGRTVTPHASLEVRTGAGKTICQFDRDGPTPRQVLPPQVAAHMAYIMNKVVEEGTARRAALQGIRAAGKTGTTNAYRPTNRMTGGSLPAMTSHEIMEYAHQASSWHQDVADRLFRRTAGCCQRIHACS